MRTVDSMLAIVSLSRVDCQNFPSMLPLQSMLMQKQKEKTLKSSIMERHIDDILILILHFDSLSNQPHLNSIPASCGCSMTQIIVLFFGFRLSTFVTDGRTDGNETLADGFFPVLFLLIEVAISYK